MPDPTLALHPAALALRQLADQIERAAKDGAVGQEAIDAVPVRDRAQVAVTLGFGEAAVAVALQDIASTIRGIEPVLRRGVEAHEREVAIGAGAGAGAGVGAGAGGVVDPPRTDHRPQVDPPQPTSTFLPTLLLALQEPYRSVLTATVALVLGALLSWLGVRAPAEPGNGADVGGNGVEDTEPQPPLPPGRRPERPAVAPAPSYREEPEP